MTSVNTTVELDLVPLSANIGTEIRGLDLRDVSDDTIAAIRRVWLERKVVFFPDQDLTPEDHLAFALRFGEPTEGHPVIKGLADNPEVFQIDYSKLGNGYAREIGRAHV